MTPPRHDRSTIALRRVSRRRLLAGTAALAAGAAAGAAVGAACGGGSSPGPEPPDASAPQSGGTLRTGTTAPLSGLDPQSEAGTGLAVAARLYGYLFHVDNRDDSILYDQADNLEQPDDLTTIVTLRDDVRFHDVDPVNGRAVMANDVVRSIERFRKNALAPTRIFYTDVLDRAEAIDDRTLRILTKRPYAYTLHNLGDISSGVIIPAEIMDRGISLYTAAIGSGPFRLDAASPPGAARIVRNPTYFRSPVPYLDAMEWQVFDTDDKKYAALDSGDVQVVTAGARAPVQAVAERNSAIEVTPEPSLSWVSLGLRLDAPPLNDARVRGAIDLALDRDALIRDLASGDGRILGPVNPQLANGFWSLFDDEVREAFGGTLEIDDRRTGARALLDAAAAAGASINLQVADVPPMLDLARLVQSQLAQVGFDVTVEPLDILIWFTNFRAGRFQATLISHIPYETPEIPLRMYHRDGPGGSGNPFAYIDAETDALIERSWAALDRTARQDPVRAAQRRIIYDRPALQLFTSTGYAAAWDHVRNRRPGLPGSLAQYNYEQWLAS